MRQLFGGIPPSNEAAASEIVIEPNDFLECVKWTEDVTTCKVAGLNGEFYEDFNFAEDEDPSVQQVLIPGVITPLNNEFNFRPERAMKCRAIDNVNSGSGEKDEEGKIDRKLINIVCEYGNYDRLSLQLRDK